MSSRGSRGLLSCITILGLILVSLQVRAQGHVTQHFSDFWIGLNVEARVSKHWSLLSESELKRKEFMAEPNAIFACLGVQYHIA
jgi:hypothetical protein